MISRRSLLLSAPALLTLAPLSAQPFTLGVGSFGGGLPSWLPQVGGIAPTLYADFTTEGAGNNYWYNGATYASEAAWLAAIGGTFSRASTGDYTNSAGLLASAASGALRFDYDPILLTSKGILLEGASTNLHLRSDISSSLASYDNLAGWTSFTANAATDPTGGSAAASGIPGTSSAQYYFRLSAGVNIVNGTVYTYSIFAKPNGYTNLQVDGDNFGTHFAAFTLSGSGSVGTQTGCTGAIQKLANGWYRLQVTFTASASGNVDPIIYTTGNGTARTYTGDGASGYYFWGEQFEAIGFASSYIPTTTTSVTRAADSLTSTVGWFTQGGPLTMLAWSQQNGLVTNGNFNVMVSIYAASAPTSNFIEIDNVASNTTIEGLARTSSNVVAGINKTVSGLTGRLAKAALTMATISDQAFTADNLSVGTGSLAFGPIANAATMQLGYGPYGGDYLWGTMSRFGYWPLRASNAQLQALTQ